MNWAGGSAPQDSALSDSAHSDQQFTCCRPTAFKPGLLGFNAASARRNSWNGGKNCEPKLTTKCQFFVTVFRCVTPNSLEPVSAMIDRRSLSAECLRGHKLKCGGEVVGVSESVTVSLTPFSSVQRPCDAGQRLPPTRNSPNCISVSLYAFISLLDISTIREFATLPCASSIARAPAEKMGFRGKRGATNNT